MNYAATTDSRLRWWRDLPFMPLSQETAFKLCAPVIWLSGVCGSVPVSQKSRSVQPM